MLWKQISIALLLISACTSPAGTSQAQDVPAAQLPDTPAGQRFGEWLRVLNSGEREQMRSFTLSGWVVPPAGSEELEKIAAGDFQSFQDNQGLVLLKATSPSPVSVIAYVQSKRTGYCSELMMRVADAAPHQILGIRRRNCEMPEDLLPREKLSREELAQRLDKLLNELIARDQFSGVVLVSQHGTPIYSRVHGLASRAWNVPNDMQTRFNLASITKMFTAVAIAQLMEQGRLSYDDSLGKFLPDFFQPEVAAITVGQLLSHTSGLSDDWMILSDRMESKKVLTVTELLEPFQKVSLQSRPGERYRYCNLGFCVLGAVIEKASSEDYYAYVQKHVFEPAGMSDSGFLELDTDPPRVATGYMDAPGGRRSNALHIGVRGMPSGCSYATAPDMAKFAEALTSGKLLAKSTLDVLWTGRSQHAEFGSRYGYGCIVRNYHGTRIIGHGGGYVGITNKYEFYPDLGYSVVILNNIDSDPNSIAYKLREWLAQGN